MAEIPIPKEDNQKSSLSEDQNERLLALIADELEFCYPEVLYAIIAMALKETYAKTAPETGEPIDWMIAKLEDWR